MIYRDVRADTLQNYIFHVKEDLMSHFETIQ